MSTNGKGAERRAGWVLQGRDVPDEYRGEWTEAVAAESAGAHREYVSAVIFRLAAEWLALPTSIFREVAAKPPIHSLPHRANSVIIGIANVRGELLTCISIASILGIEPAAKASAAPRLLIVEHNRHRMALLVDEVDAVRRYDPAEVSAVPATLASQHASRGILQMGDRTVGLLDAEALMKKIAKAFA